MSQTCWRPIPAEPQTRDIAARTRGSEGKKEDVDAKSRLRATRDKELVGHEEDAARSRGGSLGLVGVS